jgi:hypothetical protein
MSEQVVPGPYKSNWITISPYEHGSMQRTIDVLSDPDLMTQIREGKRENAPTSDFQEIAEELGI